MKARSRTSIGLTGSIGMGKSTTADLFHQAGAVVWDADAAVHRLYGVGGAAISAISKLAPDAISDGAVDRSKLRTLIAADPALLPGIEAIVHPMVQADRARFINESAADLVVCDIPLLFETQSQDDFDLIVVVSAPGNVQRQRVLDRGMSEADFEAILARQLPDAEKRARADFVIDTSHGIENARQQVDDILQHIRTNDIA